MQKGIEVDLEKVKAIMEMPPPKNISQLRSLQGWIQSIQRFISLLADKSHPFMHLLHKNVSFEWDNVCAEAFDKIKQYLTNPSTLMSTILGKPLLLYIFVMEYSLGGLLA